jgi:FkbM family methyltransferase
MAYSIDLKIANFIKKTLNYYIKKRQINEKDKENKIWIQKFNNGDFFTFNLEETTLITLYRDSLLSRLIYFGFEQREIAFIKNYLQKGDVFFDVGANIGLFSLTASRIVGIEGQIHAFEPTPETYSRLISNIELNNFTNIKANNIGLSNVNGVADFNVSNDGYDAWNSIVKLNILQNSEVIKISIETLDSYIERNGIKNIDLIKLDVEGWEKFVLEGCKKILSCNKPPVFLIEFTEENAFTAGYYCGEVYDFMKSFGFEWYKYDIINNDLKKENRKLHYVNENLIAIKDLFDCSRRINCRTSS